MPVRPAVGLTVFAALIFAATLLSRPGAVVAQTRIESYHGAWTIRCNMARHAPALCAAANRKLKAIGGGYGKRRIQTVVLRVKGGLYFQVVGPDRDDKPEPVRLELDGEFVKSIPFDCNIRRYPGCIAQIPFSRSFRSRFGKAKTATIEFDWGKDKSFTMTVPLNGLEEAVAALEKR